MSVKFYAHFDPSSFKIQSINTIAIAESEDDIVIPISEEQAENFLIRNDSVSNWVVCLDANEEWQIAKKFDVLKKVASRVDTAIFTELKGIHRAADATLRIIGKKATLQINAQYMNSKLISGLMSSITNDSLCFYVTRKNDPSFLLECISFNFHELLDNGGELTVDVTGNYGDVSIFTKKIFAFYSMEILNDD